MTEKDLSQDPMNPEDVRNFLNGPLHEGVVTVTFTKVNGDERVMECTLKSDLLPEAPAEGTTKPHKKNDNVLSVWSVKDAGWRSFRLDAIKRIEFSL